MIRKIYTFPGKIFRFFINLSFPTKLLGLCVAFVVVFLFLLLKLRHYEGPTSEKVVSTTVKYPF